MFTETRTTDAKGRVLLPKSFANSTVVVEQVGANEVRVRLAQVIPVDEIPFPEETLQPLSDRDRDIFLAILEDTSPPNEALRKAIERQKVRFD